MKYSRHENGEKTQKMDHHFKQENLQKVVEEVEILMKTRTRQNRMLTCKEKDMERIYKRFYQHIDQHHTCDKSRIIQNNVRDYIAKIKDFK